VWRCGTSLTNFILILVTGWWCFTFIYFIAPLPDKNNNGTHKITIAEKRALVSPSGWPGVPGQKLGDPLITKGKIFLDSTLKPMFTGRDTEALEEFLSLYQNRPDKVNLCGVRINHALAIFATIRHLKPTTIIESGVNAGQSTYFMRNAAGPDTVIIAIDPLEKPICGQAERWIDDNPNTQYYTGEKFKDFTEFDWDTIIYKSKTVDPSKTLVYFDDHLNVYDRFPTLLKYGFRHSLLEDNYKAGEGATVGDKAGFTPKQMFTRIDEDSTFTFHQMVTYFEFPPLVPPIMAKLYPGPKKMAGGFLHASDSANLDQIMEPLLRPDIKGNTKDEEIYKKICHQLGIDPELKDDKSYMQIMNYCFIAYFELQPLPPYLAKKWK